LSQLKIFLDFLFIESKDAMMDAVLKRHPYLIELVIDVTDAAWDRSNEEYESKFRKVIHEADCIN